MIPRLQRIRLVLVCALLLGLAHPASAEWQYAPFFGWSFATSTTIVNASDAEKHTRRLFGIAVSRLGRGPVGLEGYAVYVPGFFSDPKTHSTLNPVVDSHVYAVMGNVVLTSPSRWNQYGLRPYVSGGLGLLRADQSDIANLLPVHTSLLGMNVGGGAVGFVTDRTGLRFDLRFISNVRDPVDLEAVAIGGRIHLRYWTATVGLVLRSHQ